MKERSEQFGDFKRSSDSSVEGGVGAGVREEVRGTRAMLREWMAVGGSEGFWKKKHPLLGLYGCGMRGL